MFESLTDSITSTINKIRFHDDEKALKRALDEIKKSFLKADVHYKVVKELNKQIELDVKAKGIGKEAFMDSLKERLTEMLGGEGGKSGFIYASKPPTVILMTGLQGSGKTTTTGKLAYFLKLRNKKALIAACDLQRLAAVEQLKQIAEANELDLYYEEDNSDPISIAKAARRKAEEGHYDVLLVDTAGRLAIDEELMGQLATIRDTITPDEIFYVADSLTGQDGVKTATTFHEQIGIHGVILSKYDGDSKGGVALSITQQVGVPLRFIGIGEKIPDLEPFIPDRIVSRLMGAGDIQSLAEKTAAVIDEKEAKKVAKKIKKGQFNYNDFLEQMENMKKLGNIGSLISMVPGLNKMAPALKDLDLENSKEMVQIRAMISSMTPKERETPTLLNNSRKRRIAKGAGLDVMEVNRVIKQFTNAAKMAKKFSGKKGMQDFMGMLNQNQNAIPR